MPRAFVVLKPGPDSLTAQALIAHCRTRLAGFKTPKEIVFLGMLPRNPSGKPDRQSIERAAEEPELPG
ncbi:MAG: AMP-binding enzyme [Trebonia sp.]